MLSTLTRASQVLLKGHPQDSRAHCPKGFTLSCLPFAASRHRAYLL